MFGYIRIFKPDLTFRAYEQYRGVYCTLCRTLGKRYGFIPRMTLSYDFAFLALFGMALSKDPVRFSKGRCSFCPTKKCSYCHEEGTSAIEFAADVSVLLSYHKLEDTIRDDRFFRRVIARIMKLFFKRHFRKAENYRPEEAALARQYMREQWTIEEAAASSIDAATDPTARFLSMLASRLVAKEEDALYVERFGYCLGRFIYLADAAEDMLKDDKTGAFNPFLLPNSPCFSLSHDDRLSYAVQTLHASVAVCAEVLEEFELYRFKDILDNIVYRGMPAAIEGIRNPRRKGDF